MAHLTGFPFSPVRRGLRRGAAHRKRNATLPAAKGTWPAVARYGIKWAIVGVLWYPGSCTMFRATPIPDQGLFHGQTAGADSSCSRARAA